MDRPDLMHDPRNLTHDGAVPSSALKHELMHHPSGSLYHRQDGGLLHLKGVTVSNLNSPMLQLRPAHRWRVKEVWQHPGRL